MSRWYDVHYAYREIVLAPCRKLKREDDVIVYAYGGLQLRHTVHAQR